MLNDRGWLGVERWQLCLRDISCSAKCNWHAAVGHWVSLCVGSAVGWLIVYQLGILSLSCNQYSQTICWHRWYDNACLGVKGHLISKCLFGVFTFFQKTNETKSTSSKNEFDHSFFGRNFGLKKSFRICLTFTSIEWKISMFSKLMTFK